MTEVAKRLAPKQETLRELFLKSGNLCAYPGCSRLMMNEAGVFVGQVCHIEGAEVGGERFNPDMTNEERRSAANLMLMCYDHHFVTNDVEPYTVEILRGYKRDHEIRFSRPDRTILESLTDWTRQDEPTAASNLKRMSALLEWGLSDDELQESALALQSYIERFRLVPVDVRRFVGAVAMRIQRMKNTSAVSDSLGGDSILASDLRGALGLQDSSIIQRINEMEAYNLGSLDHMYQNDMPQPAVEIHRLDGWPLWPNLAEFCEKAPESMEAFTVELDFHRLDS